MWARGPYYGVREPRLWNHASSLGIAAYPIRLLKDRRETGMSSDLSYEASAKWEASAQEGDKVVTFVEDLAERLQRRGSVASRPL